MPEAIRVAPWPDPVLDVIGHDPRSWYAETFWLPTLGPTALSCEPIRQPIPFDRGRFAIERRRRVVQRCRLALGDGPGAYSTK